MQVVTVVGVDMLAIARIIFLANSILGAIGLVSTAGVGIFGQGM